MPGNITLFPTQAWTDKRLTPTDILVLGVIAAHWNEDRGAWPKRTTVAGLLEIAPNSVTRCINRLKSFGYVTAVRQFRKDGGQRENRYTVEFKSNSADIPAQDIVDGDEPDTQAAPPPTPQGVPPPKPSTVEPPYTAAVEATKEEQYNMNKPPSPHGGDEIEKAFDQIWSLWPDQGRKHSPGRAMILRALEKVADGIPLDDIVAAVRGFVRSSDPKFAPSLSKWLRERKFEAWLPKQGAIANTAAASEFSTTPAVPLPERAAKCLAALQSRYGHTSVATWFRSATWDVDEVRFPTAFERDRVEANFGGVLHEHGFSAVEGSAAA